MTDNILPLSTAKDLGKAIRDERKMLGWTQERLAAEMGHRSRQTVVSLEAGQNVGVYVLLAALSAMKKGLRIESVGRIEFERLKEVFADNED